MTQPAGQQRAMTKPTVAILGASADRSKFGNKSVRAHLQQGFDVYPINPKGGEIEGLTVYRSLAEVPVEHLTRVSVYLPPKIGLTMLPEIAAKGCDELWLNPGSDSPELVQQAQALGLETIQACSIVALGVHPEAMGS
jgi:predicted CoA-binding protein